MIAKVTLNDHRWTEAEYEAESLPLLPANWDGEGADPVPKELAKRATTILADRKSRGYPPPWYVYATAGGTPMIEWHWPDGRAEIVNVRSSGDEVVIRDPGREPRYKVQDQ